MRPSVTRSKNVLKDSHRFYFSKGAVEILQISAMIILNLKQHIKISQKTVLVNIKEHMDTSKQTKKRERESYAVFRS